MMPNVKAPSSFAVSVMLGAIVLVGIYRVEYAMHFDATPVEFITVSESAVPPMTAFKAAAADPTAWY